MKTMTAAYPVTESRAAELLARFRRENPQFFRKNNAVLYAHLAAVAVWIGIFTAGAVMLPWILLKIVCGAAAGFGWFCLFNVTMHHHQTHKNAAADIRTRRLLDILYRLALPNAPRRLPRYTRAHLNHHARPFHETDVDHHYGLERYAALSRTLAGKLFYFIELTFVGGHVPGWQDDHYMNTVPLENWTRADYQQVKAAEIRQAQRTALWQWGVFSGIAIAAAVLKPAPAAYGLEIFAWGWAFPMLMVKNWAHYLGQFQHYDESLRAAGRPAEDCTRTFRGVPSWLNALAGGEITGHFLHHLYPEMPYYHVEAARKAFAADAELAQTFFIY